MRFSSTAALCPARPMPEPELLGVAHDVEPVHLGPAAVGREQRGQDADRRGLARAVRPEQAEHRAGLDLEVDALERLDVAEVPHERFGADDGIGHERVMVPAEAERHPCAVPMDLRPWTCASSTFAALRAFEHEGECAARVTLRSEVCMQLDTEVRLVPTRLTSASREVVRSRQHVDAACSCLELALEMYCGAEREPAGAPLSALRDVLRALEDSEMALWEAAQ